MAERNTWVLVDGENIDATLGGSILGRRPQPDERPRWDRLLSFGYRPVPLSGPSDAKVVDLAIQRTLAALEARDADVVLVSHDRDFVEGVAALAGPDRRVGVIGFQEFRSAELTAIPDVEFFDLEYDAQAFDARLPRVRIIPIEEFDPAAFLD